MKQPDIRTIDIACLGGLIGLTLVGSLLAVQTAKGKAKAIENHNTRVKTALVDLEQAQLVLGKLDKAIELNQIALEDLNRRLPASQAIGKFIEELDAVIAGGDVTLDSLVPGKPVRDELCSRTPIRLSCSGPFASLHALLYDLETQSRVVRIERLTLEKPSRGDLCRMTVECEAYGR